MTIHAVDSSADLLRLLREQPRPLRISVLGSCGSGKSTLADHLGRELDIKSYHLDEFFWLPNWGERPDAEMAEMIRGVVQQETWVIDGNYTRFQPIIRERVEIIIWLNFGFWTTFRQLWKRTLPRLRRGQEVFPGCRESYWKQFASRKSIFVIFLQIYRRHRARNRALFDQLDHQQKWMLVEVTDPRHVHFTVDPAAD